MSEMSLKKHNSTYYVSKEYAVRQLLPHLTYRSGWAKIKEALGDDPCLRRAFTTNSKYLYISEFRADISPCAAPLLQEGLGEVTLVEVTLSPAW
jgi:hypothetical protein